MPVKPVTKEEMINSYKSVERRQSSSSRMFGGYDFEYINLYNAGELMDSWAALQTGERNERIEKLQKRLLEYTEITGTLIEAQDRIEELTNLLYDQWWRRHKEAGISETDIQTAWQQFKTKYNL